MVTKELKAGLIWLSTAVALQGVISLTQVFNRINILEFLVLFVVCFINYLTLKGIAGSIVAAGRGEPLTLAKLTYFPLKLAGLITLLVVIKKFLENPMIISFFFGIGTLLVVPLITLCIKEPKSK